MKRFWCLFLLSGVLCTGLQAEEWVESYTSARKLAVQRKKKILIFFSGSDWCEAGRALDRDLFRTSGFQRLASEKYVLYNADFPKYTRLGAEAETRNKRLAARYGIHRFPAVVVVDPRFGGLLVRQVGMTDMTPKKLLDKLSRIETESVRSYQVRPAGSAEKMAP